MDTRLFRPACGHVDFVTLRISEAAVIVPAGARKKTASMSELGSTVSGRMSARSKALAFAAAAPSRYRMCAYKDRLPARADAWLWAGELQSNSEARRISSAGT